MYQWCSGEGFEGVILLEEMIEDETNDCVCAGMMSEYQSGTPGLIGQEG